jgi:hypothetical protein
MLISGIGGDLIKLRLAIGYLLHSVWDYFHHPVQVSAQITQR